MKKRTVYIAVIAAIAACAAGGYGFYLLEKKKVLPDAQKVPEEMTLAEGSIAAVGLTGVGMLEETCELGFLQDGLYVEETYLNMGDEVEVGTAVFKVSEASLESARRELEKQVQETALNRRQGAIAYESGLIDAQKEKELAAVEAEYAQSVYDNEVAKAQSELDELQSEVDEAQKKVDEYTASIEEDYYYTYYEVAQKEEEWKDNAAFLMELYNEWNVETLEDLYKGTDGKKGTGYVTNQVSAQKAAGAESASEQSGAAGAADSASGKALSSADGDTAPGVFFSLETIAGTWFTQESISGIENGTLRSESTGSTSESGASESESVSGTTGGGASENGNVSGTTGGGTSESGSVSEANGSETGGDASGEGSGSAADTGEDGSGAGDTGVENGGSDPEEGSGGPDKSPEAGNAGFEKGEGNGALENGFGMNGGVNVSDDEIRYNIYLAMEEETEESEQAYETALENYENARDLAKAGIAEAKSELIVLQAKLKEQQTAYEKAVISAKLTYDLAVSNEENAQMVYEAAVRQLEEEYETLKEEEETAAQNLALFEATIADGIFYTSAAGTVMMTGVRESQWITQDTVVVAYSNPDTVTIAAYVDQADIASVEIGQEALVLISGYGTYTGKVTSIDPVSAANGSSVTYPVNVRLEGDVSELEANLTAYVYLGLSEEDQERMSGSGMQKDEKGMKEQGDEEGMTQGNLRGDTADGFPDGHSQDHTDGMTEGEGGMEGGFENGGMPGENGFGPSGGGR